MISRRRFSQISAAMWLSLMNSVNALSIKTQNSSPIVVSTWNNQKANQIAYDALIEEPGALLDAIESAVNSVEENEKDLSVGYGGLPDNSGKVSLDACIMDHKHNAGSVCFLRDIVHAVSVARKVMEESPHVMLAGQGAQDFALEHGFEKTDMLSEQAEKAYLKWKKNPVFSPEINGERHDTIGLLAMDSASDLSGACSTSGLSYKTPGRVGDSPIIGSGLYVDNKVGAATATGLGELIMKCCSTFLVVEKMKQGLSPENACRYAIEMIVETQDYSGKQAGLIAINKQGEVGAYAIQKGFIYTVADADGIRVLESNYYL